ncbi:hypothetical protein LTR35_016471 [Friedmanniomyces endolithicus]|uniref:Uncharacterized protein n=1 Tax=Friedmanniomyces endolithicus TaxID=329885 RepID=A0AAN6F8H8_9PEZI|nr:hypothetical protein LTR35_016471 [Friedmanniomyces endolithicus]KAK0274000.1 hypothetical protein LTS00_015545 [Friedmanniomyces endolithicus]KAK0306271.1 hypothetical protein LTR82_016397 [Friedmanniomyces endolithicus]KAK0978166.1 hypothetical protein LTR54_015979 [Friedmanniomyces endolithicus]
MSTTLTWLITGASSGQGAEISLGALRAGHSVVATARNTAAGKAAYPDIEKLGGIWATLDVTEESAQSTVEKLVDQHSVNVVVNNAGYGLRGVLEDLNMQQIRSQMETNFFGALAVTKGAIPHFRQHRTGTIVMISSASGFSGTPSQSMYSGSKFALEGVSESIAEELAPFGIRVLMVELGAYRTPFQNAVDKPADVMSEPYKGTISDKTAQRITAGHGRQAGDPVKAAQAIVEIVTGTGRGADLSDVLRLPLGRDAVTRAQVKMKSFSHDMEKGRELAEWAVFDEPYDGYPPL